MKQIIIVFAPTNESKAVSKVKKYKIIPIYKDNEESNILASKIFYNFQEILEFLAIKCSFDHNNFQFKDEIVRKNFINDMNYFLKEYS